jgi:hypothetical protein
MMSPDSLMLSPLLTTSNPIHHPQIQPNNLRFEKEEPHNNLIQDQEEENESTGESSGKEYDYVDEIPEDELSRLNTTYGKKTITLRKEYIIKDYLFLSKTLKQKPKENLKKLKVKDLTPLVKELLDEYNNLE